MPATLYGFPFDEDLFSYRYANEPDVVSTAIMDSGAVQENQDIADQIAGGSAVFSVPFYKTIGGTPQNYDGNTDITLTETEGGYQSGIVFGRMKGWMARDFVFDFNNGADPMSQIVSQTRKYWSKYHQSQVLAILNGLFGITPATGFEQWSNHSTDISSANTTVAASNKLGETSIGDAITKACGDMAQGSFSLAFMHSAVANNLAGLQLLNYRKYTDPQGIERQLAIADINGLTVVVTDQVPYAAATSEVAAKYTTYLLGAGAFQTANAPVKNAVEAARDAKTKGGEDLLIMRERKTLHPNGFSFTAVSGDIPSPTDTALGTATRWAPVYNPKSIAMARIISNG